MRTREEYIKEIDHYIHKAGIGAKKSLGQNFLVDYRVTQAMIDGADLQKDDTVLEVGPGLGFLTEEIVGRVKKVLAIEKDDSMSRYLLKKFGDKIELLNDDILTVDFSTLGLENNKYKVVANLPFYLTSHFMRIILESELKPSIMVLLIQKEVAKRIVAAPGKHSLLSLTVQLYGDVEILDYADRTSFDPAPNVDTAIIRVKLLDSLRIEVDDVDKLFRMMKIGFSSKRKQLHNNYSSGLQISVDEAKELLGKADISSDRRAQSLDWDEWGRLYEVISKIV